MAVQASIRTLSIALSAVLLAGCSALGGNSAGSAGSADKAATTQAAPNYQPVTDIPIPAGTRINTERSVILGGADRWYGKMLLVLDRPTTQAYAYYQEQMGTFGWEPVTAIQGKVSTITFVRSDRAATVEIGPSGLRGSEVSVTVSPRQPAPAAPAPSTKK